MPDLHGRYALPVPAPGALFRRRTLPVFAGTATGAALLPTALAALEAMAGGGSPGTLPSTAAHASGEEIAAGPCERLSRHRAGDRDTPKEERSTAYSGHAHRHMP